MTRRGPLAGRYPAAAAMVIFALVPYLALSSAMQLVSPIMVAPVFAHFAATVGGNLNTGTGIALSIGLGIAAGGAVIAVLVYVLGGARAQTPDLERFFAGQGAAWYSPPVLAGIRRPSTGRTLAEEPARP